MSLPKEVPSLHYRGESSLREVVKRLRDAITSVQDSFRPEGRGDTADSGGDAADRSRRQLCNPGCVRESTTDTYTKISVTHKKGCTRFTYNLFSKSLNRIVLEHWSPFFVNGERASPDARGGVGPR